MLLASERRFLTAAGLALVIVGALVRPASLPTGIALFVLGLLVALVQIPVSLVRRKRSAKGD